LGDQERRPRLPMGVTINQQWTFSYHHVWKAIPTNFLRSPQRHLNA
jgi:hypothetical protein